MTTSALVNKLYYGENLRWLREFPAECVDLVYLDPPWNAKADYNVIFRDQFGRSSLAQRGAFAGTWNWGPETEDHYAYLTQTARHRGAVPAPVGALIAALRAAIGTNQMMAFVTQMTVRLVEMRRLLRPTGSLYFHSDPTASHYLKLILDVLFGAENFRNEIIWKRTSAHSSAKRYGPIHDVILYYARSPDCVWNPQYLPHDAAYLASHYRNRDASGRPYTLSDLTAAGTRRGSSGQPWRGFEPSSKGNHWKFTIENLERLDTEGRLYWPTKGGWPRYRRFLDEVAGTSLQDVWTDVAPVNAKARERTGWGTQKPVALLDRIIQASSNPGDIILDPFCGCGTALDSAEGLGRHWIGIDITWHSIAVMKARLLARFGIEPQVEGAPTEVEGARQLAQQKPNGREQFEAWALTLVGAVPHGGPQKKGADQGADGVVTFSGRGTTLESAIVSAKSGHADASDVQKLKGAMQRHGGALGLFVTLEEPSKPMRQEAATAGLYHSDVSGKEYQRVQILTIRELIEQGRKPDLPPLLTSEFRETLWSEAEVPAAPRSARRRQPRSRPPIRSPAPPPITTDLVDRIREGYAQLADETGGVSRAAPRSPRTSRRDLLARRP